jgi:formate dehydrogenase subunit gamma
MNPAPALEQPRTVTTEINRHSGYVRFLHWFLAAGFIVAMGTGFALYWTKLLGWMVPLFGGKYLAITLHFLSGMGLALVAVPLFSRWRRLMGWTPADSHFVRHLKDHAMRPDQLPPPDTGFFNGGQKLYFWSVMISTALFLFTGLVWWWREEMPVNFYAVCRTSHRILGIIMSAGLVVHLYKATLGEPGTLRSMLTGTVTADWARLRRPKWFRDRGGR